MITRGINVEVERNPNENATNLLRRFTKRVQGAGILPRVRSLRYAGRPSTKFLRKKRALKGLARRKEVSRLIKLGKMADKRSRD